MKIPVVQRDAYTIYFEQVMGVTFTHCDVYKWNRTTRANLLNDSEAITALHGGPLYAYHTVGDTKHLKFLKMLGFEYVKTGLQNDLRLTEIYKKEIPDGS